MKKREFILKALVGSHNYKLNTKGSDKDYKGFVAPTFEELYKHQYYSNQTVTELVDISEHDIRKLPDLLFKSNLNFMEVLFSDEITMINSPELQEIFSLKDEIARINLPYLYNACAGTHIQKMNALNKGTEGTQHLVDKFGFDTKQAVHAYRVENFPVRFEATGFTDFKKAMTYEGEDRDFILSIKHGEFSEETFRNFMKHYHESTFIHMKEVYHSYKPNLELKERLDQLIMQLVKKSILETI